MKFYKLELINREDSYNKMFGANPNIGLVNPLGVSKAQNGKQMPLGIGSAAMAGNMGPGLMTAGGKGIT